MIDEVTMFWLIHLFLGIIVPVLMWTGCCRQSEQEAASSSNALPNMPGEGWDTSNAK